MTEVMMTEEDLWRNKMKLPTVLKINGVEYAVEAVSKLFDEDNTPLYGQFDEDEQLISINTTNQGIQGQWRTLLHEVCHALLYEYDIGCHGYEDRLPKNEEDMCEIFSRGVFQLLRDNDLTELMKQDE